jgi:thiol-disulfide isomerase/thioredoxin
MSTSTRWTIAGLVVVVIVIVALAAQLRDRPPGAPAPQQPPADSEQLAGLRERAQLAPCPTGTAPGPVALRGIAVQCAADGATVDAARVVGGRAVLLNFWAYWCLPCRAELPAMSAYQQRAGAAVTVVSVHSDDDQAAGLALLADLGVRLPTLQDGGRRIAGALHAPNVLPVTVVLRPDGSVAATLPRAFANADEIASAVDPMLGVRH